jgi:hypothetical protein
LERIGGTTSRLAWENFVTDVTLLHRQINPTFMQGGRVTSQAFKPTPKDQGLLSVYDGNLITAENSWKHFTAVRKLPSVGVLSVTVAECQELGLPPRSDTASFPEHAVIDFTGFGTNQIEKKAKRVQTVAVMRGWQYSAEQG